MDQEPARPLPAGARPADLSDADCQELQDLLDDRPGGEAPFGLADLDGFLCCVIVQPIAIDRDDWLPHVFADAPAAPPAGIDAGALARTTALIDRRMAALRRAIVEDGDFEPLVFAGPEGDDEAHDASGGDASASPDDAPWASLTPIQQALAPWIAGFVRGLDAFPALLESTDDSVGFALARVLRHLPPQDDEQAEMQALLDRELPLADLDDAIDDLVDAVVELHDLTRDARFKVETVRRDAPKVGRNDPCPCGGGKKFKNCHGRS